MSIVGCNKPATVTQATTPGNGNPASGQAGVKEATKEEVDAFLADPQVPQGLKTAMSSPQLSNAARAQIMNQYRQKHKP